ncbi:MAG: hypothetical protein QM539_09565 [Alphaproteobacteria bacterium]|nr:hypothetical protein [Alphaproteobacteria bacterium]
MIKILWITILFLCQDTKIDNFRITYQKANTNNIDLINQFINLTKSVQDGDNNVFQAYKGAGYFLAAKINKNLLTKLEDCKKGGNLIEDAIKADPQNYELRFIRLSIQENLPDIVHYNQNIPEDKTFLLNHYHSLNTEFKAYIYKFIMYSKSFTNNEKQQLEKN